MAPKTQQSLAPTTMPTVKPSIANNTPPPILGEVELPSPKASQPIAVVIQRMPQEKHDFSGDIATGLFGLVGVLVGAAISIATNWLMKKADDAEKNRYALFTLTQKNQKIYSVLNSIHKSFSAGCEAAKSKGEPYLFHRVLPPSNSFAPVSFDPDEFWRSKVLAGHNFANNVALLDDHYNGLISVIERYGNERSIIAEELSRICPPGDEGYNLDYLRDDLKQYHLKFDTLDRMVKSILENADQDRRRAHSAIIALHKATGKFTKKNSKIALTSPEGIVEEINSIDA
jgi:hypothetical protein